MALCHFGHFYIADVLMQSMFLIVHAGILKFQIWISNEKIADMYFFFLIRMALPEPLCIM